MKRIAQSVASLIALPCVLWLLALYAHNRTTHPVQRAELETAYDNGVTWLVQHRAEIIDHQNPTLWWLLKRTAESRQDPRLGELVNEHLARHWGSKSRSSIWRPMLRPGSAPAVSTYHVSQLPDYNQLFIYGLSCNRTLEADPVIRRQLEANFCWRHHPISPACTTHQLLGITFAITNRCGDVSRLESIAQSLQQDILVQLTLDPRLVDVFLQRLLMLSETGQTHSLKPMWIRRALHAQRPDGGWSDMQPLLPLGGGRYLGLVAKGVSIAPPASNIHATAQGLRLTALLLNNYPSESAQ